LDKLRQKTGKVFSVSVSLVVYPLFFQRTHMWVVLGNSMAVVAFGLWLKVLLTFSLGASVAVSISISISVTVSDSASVLVSDLADGLD